MKNETLRGLVRTSGAGVFGAALLLSAATAAHASVTLQDNYYGGNDFYSGTPTGVTVGGSPTYAGDVIGDSDFDISDAVISRSVDGKTLNITINTNYAGKDGLDDTHYGSLFLTPGANAWNPDTSALGDATDVYKPGEWKYAFVLPTVENGGAVGLYLVASDANVVRSNVDGNPISAPLGGNPGWYFREDQAVQYDPTSGQSALAAGTFSVVNGSSITFSIQDNGLLTDNFAMSWAMTCANDVLQGQVSGVPEPGTWAMMLLGFGLVGFAVRRKKSFTASDQQTV